MGTCLEWATERTEECSEWADQGYSECSDWDDECCDWWPCSWACEVITWICVATVWISNVVCVAWTVITTTVCVLWDIVVTVVGAIITTIESILGWVLSALAFLVELILSIPVVGTILGWILKGLTAILAVIIAIPDFVLGLIGIRPEKKLRVCTVILRDEKGTVTAPNEFAVALLQKACDIYKRDANIRIVRSAAFQYSTGFAGAETVTDAWVQIDSGNSDAEVLDPPCSDGISWTAQQQFQWKMSLYCFFQSWRRILGYGAPVTAFIVRQVDGAWGCGSWVLDFVTISGGTFPPGNLRVIGHEIGHACLLSHRCVDDDIRNMMGTGTQCDPDSGTTPDYADPRMTNWQALVIRSSKHATYF